MATIRSGGARRSVLRHRLRPGAWASPALVVVLFLVAAAGGAQSGEIVFEKLNREYSAFITELEAIEVGAATVALRSPEHRVVLESNRVTMRRLQDGSFFVNLELRLWAEGTIVADVALGRIRSTLEDALEAPSQELRLSGRIALERVEGGYVVTTLEIPEAVTVEIHSKLAGQLFALCRQMALVLVNLQCEELERSLTYLRVPMPPPGEQYLLPDDELTEENRARLEALLGG